MRKNWTQIFAAVPNITADVPRSAVNQNTVWTEWDLRGTRLDGAPAHTVMVTIAGVQDDQIVWMRLYMEQVQEGEGIDASVRAAMGVTGDDAVGVHGSIGRAPTWRPGAM